MPQIRRHRLLPLALAALLAGALPTLAQASDDDAPPPSMAELLDASSPADWRSLDPENTVYLELDAGRVIIELAPDFAPANAENVRTLARGHFWDGLSVYRSHDNFVVQWGDPESGDARRPIGAARDALPAEFERSA
ncbi:MAG TPA: peptidylprolyl isomerase, partial [Candidatus Luteimonas excrementigallinarum]|nr:peptidylprolyl isomerase [Candidatus Luteimonas excrementigallinarum]